jgi:hypothetical protein
MRLPTLRAARLLSVRRPRVRREPAPAHAAAPAVDLLPGSHPSTVSPKDAVATSSLAPPTSPRSPWSGSRHRRKVDLRHAAAKAKSPRRRTIGSGKARTGFVLDSLFPFDTLHGPCPCQRSHPSWPSGLCWPPKMNGMSNPSHSGHARSELCPPLHHLVLHFQYCAVDALPRFRSPSLTTALEGIGKKHNQRCQEGTPRRSRCARPRPIRSPHEALASLGAAVSVSELIS